MKKILSTTSKLGVKIDKYQISTGASANDIALDVVTEIASVCYKSNTKGNQRLYDMLMTESHNLPSTSFEFVPIEIDMDDIFTFSTTDMLVSNVIKYGYENGTVMWITNLRALLYDVNTKIISHQLFDKIMEKKYELNHNLFFFKNMNMFTFGQFVRHRELSFQILSRRYVSGKKEDITFNRGISEDSDSYYFCEYSKNVYNELIEKGTKKEIARGVLPQFATTQGWFKFNTIVGMQNFFNLRTKTKAQEDIREFAISLERMMQ